MMKKVDHLLTTFWVFLGGFGRFRAVFSPKIWYLSGQQKTLETLKFQGFSCGRGDMI